MNVEQLVILEYLWGVTTLTHHVKSRGPNIKFRPQVSTRDVNRGPIIESVGTEQFPVNCNFNEFSRGLELASFKC